MALALFGSGICLALGFSSSSAIVNPDGSLSMGEVEGIIYVVMVCIFTAGFAWSWGPMGWLVPTEVRLVSSKQADCVCMLLILVHYLYSVCIWMYW